MEATTARHSGWVTLVGVLFLIGGAFNVIWGLVALGVSLGGSDPTVIGDLSAGNLEGLGIAGVIVGVLQLLAGGGIMSRNPAAWGLGMFLAIISVLMHFAYHRVLDGWAFTGMVFSLAVIIILTVKRDEFV